MPIKDKSLYPKDWKAIASEIRKRAGDRCECLGHCGNHLIRCIAQQGSTLFLKGTVVLTTAHLCFTPSCVDRKHLLSMCQTCHNRYDSSHRVINSRKTREAKRLKAVSA